MADINRDRSFDEESVRDEPEPRGQGDMEDDEFEDADEVEGDEEEFDEDLDVERGAMDRSFTAEIGSEGGSQGDMETQRNRPRVTTGSEATSTAVPDEKPSFHDRHAGGGVPPGDRD